MSRIEYKGILAYHPGYYLKEMIDDMAMSQEELAKRLNATPKHVSDLINGKSKLSEELASKLATVFNTSVKLWLNLNVSYIEKSIEIDRLKKLDEECEIARKIDYSYFVKLNLLPNRRKTEDKVTELLKYFKVATLKVLCRKDFLVQYKEAVSSIEDINLINANAWVQTAMNIGSENETEVFNEKKLVKNLSIIKSMTKMNPENFSDDLFRILSECGVSLVFLPNLKNSGINGAVKWLNNDKVLLALNDRKKYADYFWFALFHELGHVLQKRKKLIILSNGKTLDYKNEELLEKLEEDANNFASNYLIDYEKYEQFIGLKEYKKDSIVRFSNEIGVHPGIVVGRLQRDKKIEFNQFNDLRVKYTITR